MAQEKIVQTAGRDQLGEFAPKFAELNDDVLFWHGAAADSWFAHLAGENASNEWLEPVTDEEYDKLKQ